MLEVGGWRFRSTLRFFANSRCRTQPPTSNLQHPTYSFQPPTYNISYLCPNLKTMVKSVYDPVKYKTPIGNKLSCKGWIQEAALRMLLNNLNPDVAERPDDLIVYGGRGKAARNFEALDM